MIDRATDFAARLRIPAEHCNQIACDAVTFAWEECKFGRATAEDDSSFWAIVSRRLYEIRNGWRQQDRSLSAQAYRHSDSAATLYEAGWIDYQPPEQFHCCALREVIAAFELLPRKHAGVMTRLARGYNALDIADELRIPVHSVFLIIRQSRTYLFGRELLAMAKDEKRKCPSRS